MRSSTWAKWLKLFLGMVPFVLAGSACSPEESLHGLRSPAVAARAQERSPSAVTARPESLSRLSRRPATPIGSAEASRRLLVVLIGGFDCDPTPAQMDGSAPRGTGKSGLYQLAGDLQELGLATEYFNWDGSRAGRLGREAAPGAPSIARFIREDQRKNGQASLALVGNSWGAYTALELVSLLAAGPESLRIEQLHLLDPATLLRSLRGLPAVPDNVGSVSNYFSRHWLSSGALPADQRVVNIDLGDPSHGFLRDDWARYDRRDDWTAHVLVEWDPLIHEDVKRRLAALVAAK